MFVYHNNDRENASNPHYPYRVKVNSIEDLSQAVSYDNTPVEFKDNHRSRENFGQSDCIMLDVDARSQDSDIWRVPSSTPPMAEAASKADPAIRTSVSPVFPEAASNCRWLAAAAVLADADCRRKFMYLVNGAENRSASTSSSRIAAIYPPPSCFFRDRISFKANSVSRIFSLVGRSDTFLGLHP